MTRRPKAAALPRAPRINDWEITLEDALRAAHRLPPWQDHRKNRTLGARTKHNRRRRIAAEQNWRCCHRGKILEPETVTLEHIIPRVHGGTWTWANL